MNYQGIITRDITAISANSMFKVIKTDCFSLYETIIEITADKTAKGIVTKKILQK